MKYYICERLDRLLYKFQFDQLKAGYMGFGRLESSVDATPAVMLSPAVAMAAGGRWHWQWTPAAMATAALNITAGVASAEYSNWANSI